MPREQGVLGRSIPFATHSRNALVPEFSSTRTYGDYLGQVSSHKNYRYNGHSIPPEDYGLQVRWHELRS